MILKTFYTFFCVFCEFLLTTVQKVEMLWSYNKDTLLSLNSVKLKIDNKLSSILQQLNISKFRKTNRSKRGGRKVNKLIKVILDCKANVRDEIQSTINHNNLIMLTPTHPIHYSVKPTQ